MPVGTTIFSHILPVILGFFGILLIISGLLDEKKRAMGNWNYTIYLCMYFPIYYIKCNIIK